MRAIKDHLNRARVSDRTPLYARLRLATVDGHAIASRSYCTNIGLGGLRVTAGHGLAPGTRVQASVDLPSGKTFEARGVVAWCKTTLHPALFGSTQRFDDDAILGIAFEAMSADELLPVARLLAARDDERRRGRRLRRRVGYAIHA